MKESFVKEKQHSKGNKFWRSHIWLEKCSMEKKEAALKKNTIREL